MSIGILVFLVFVAATAGIVGVAMLLSSRGQLQREKAIQNRLQEVSRGGATAAAEDKFPSESTLLRQESAGPLPNIDKVATEALKGSSIERFLQQSGTAMTISSVVLMTLMFGALASIMTYMFTHLMWVAMLAFVAGLGIQPNVEPAEQAGLLVENGIVVDEYARTSNPHVYAAGDVAEFPYLALERRMRIEHENHANEHGAAAGANMAGANRPYDVMPYFYSDLFDLGWEAVGQVDSSLDAHPVWKEPQREGIVFYLSEDVIRGVLLWNVWDHVDWARNVIRDAKPTTGAEREKLAMASMAVSSPPPF